MYKDFFPPLPTGIRPPTPVVAVITRNERVRPEAVISVCHRYGATSQQSEGLCFWVVYEDNPKRAVPFTREGLRASVDEHGYIKCESYDPTDKRDRGKEVEDYLLGVGNWTSEMEVDQRDYTDDDVEE